MSTSETGGTPPTQPAFLGNPPRPPNITARGIADQPDDPNRIIFLPEVVQVSELARKLNVKPFQIVADLLATRHFKHADDTIDFELASDIARNYGYQAMRLSDAST